MRNQSRETLPLNYREEGLTGYLKIFNTKKKLFSSKEKCILEETVESASLDIFRRKMDKYLSQIQFILPLSNVFVSSPLFCNRLM